MTWLAYPGHIVFLLVMLVALPMLPIMVISILRGVVSFFKGVVSFFTELPVFYKETLVEQLAWITGKERKQRQREEIVDKQEKERREQARKAKAAEFRKAHPEMFAPGGPFYKEGEADVPGKTEGGHNSLPS